MKQHTYSRMLRMLAALAVTLCAQAGSAAVLAALKGEVTIERGQQVLRATIGMRIEEADTMVLAPDSEALVRFDDGAKMVLRSQSRLGFEQLVERGRLSRRKSTLNLAIGGMRYVSSKLRGGNHASFRTGNASIGIRGTDIEIAVTEDGASGNQPGTYLKVNTGLAVLVGLDGTQVELAPGQVAVGTEPDLTPRGPGAPPGRPAARKLSASDNSMFKPSELDRMLK